MSRKYIALCAALLIAACGGPKDPEPAASVPEPSPVEAAPAEPAATAPAPTETQADEPIVTSSGGTKLRYFNDVLDSDQPQKPSFELEADRLSMTEDNVWLVEKATAVAYGKDGSETKFEAGAGRFDDNTKMTQLSGDVVCTMGTQRVEMQDVTWTNETQTAATENPVVVSDGETRLQAGSMEYNTDTKTLLLRALSGAVSLKDSQTDAGSGEAGAFEFIDITKGGLGTFVDGQLQDIAGGVAIALRSADPNAPPMQLAAAKVGFTWDDGERTKPKAIELEGDVSVDGPQGLITANRADLDLAGNALVFAGNVHGQSESIESFDAERIAYDMKTGDSEMSNLVARGIAMSASGEDAKSGAADFSRMNIEHAGNVKSIGGQVKEMTGGVSIALEPRAAGGTPMKLNAGAATFSWSGDGGQPTAIAMRGSVRVDGPQGAIHADKADLNLAKKELVFAGKVNGSLPQLERFDSDKLVYNVESGETLMTNLTAKGLVIATEEKTDKPAEDAGTKKGFSRMDIETAPEVSLTGQKLNWMHGGISLIMRAANPDEPPLTVKAQELTFAYDDEQTSPRRIVLKQDVAMKLPAMFVNSDQADLNLGANAIVFTGNVSGSTPQVRDFTATELSYDMTTGQVTTKGSKAASLSTKTQEPATQP